MREKNRRKASAKTFAMNQMPQHFSSTNSYSTCGVQPKEPSSGGKPEKHPRLSSDNSGVKPDQVMSESEQGAQDNMIHKDATDNMISTLNIQDIEDSEVAIVSNNSKLHELVPGKRIRLQKFNKIGGHTVIYKYRQYLIKQLDYENNIYELITRKNPQNPLHAQLQPYLPRYYGTVQLKLGGTIQEFIVIEDLSNSLAKPYIIDLKMGTRQYGLRASEDKVSSQRQKCQKSTSLSLGVRLCGLQIIQNDRIIIYDKYYGRKLTQEGFCVHLLKFLTGVDLIESCHQRLLEVDPMLLQLKLMIIIEQLQKLQHILLQLDYYRFYGSSILILYDNNRLKQYLEKQQQNCLSAQLSIDQEGYDLIKVKLIDFSKSFITNDQEFAKLGLHHGKDYGYLKGVFSLIKLFTAINKTQVIDQEGAKNTCGTNSLDPEYEYNGYTSE